MRARRPVGPVLGFRFCLIIAAFNQNLKAKTNNEQPKQAQARTETMVATAATKARRLDSLRTESRKYTNMPLMPVNTASITAAKPVAHGPSLIELRAAVHSKIVCCSK